MACSSLINITIPESVHKIGPSAFAFCSGLNSIIIPSNIASIESCTFYKCANLKEVQLSKKLSVINYKSFSGCTKLEQIVIPSGVNTIGSAAFMLCEKLKTVKFMGKKPAHMEKYIFDECSQNLTILYPKKYKSSWADYTEYPKVSHNDVETPVSKISLNRKEVILVKGKKYKLKSRITPLDADIKSVTWKSSNKKIATVSKKGLVKTKKVGTCTITVISKDGNKKARCRIRVILPVKKVKISEKQISIKKEVNILLKLSLNLEMPQLKKWYGAVAIRKLQRFLKVW